VITVPEETWYRFVDMRHANVDEWDNHTHTYTAVYLQRFKVIKHTPKGVWLQMFFQKRFVLNGARKKFACPTIEEAKESFRARKRAQIRILSSKIANAKEAMYLIDNRRFE